MNSRILIISGLLLLPLGANAEKLFLSDVELSSSYNDNVFLSGDKEDILNTSDTSIDEDIQTQFTLGTSYKFYDGANSDSKVIIDFFYENLQKNAINTTIASIDLPWSYYTESFRFRVTPKISQYGVDGESALTYFGSKVDVTKKYGHHQLGLYYQYTESRANDDSYSSYSGDHQQYYIQYTKRQLLGKFNLRMGRHVQRYQQDIDDESYSGYVVSSRYMLMKKKFKLSLYAKVKTKNYENSFVLGESRFDVNTTVSISPSYRLTKSLAIYSKLSYTKNISNISDDFEDKNYSQTLTTLGLNYRF